MSPSLEQAVSIAARLPLKDQDVIAKKIKDAIERIADTAHWDVQFADSHDVLESLYDEGMVKYAARRTLTIAS